jgi:C4-dicarboxylate transporter, DctQ subunit
MTKFLQWLNKFEEIISSCALAAMVIIIILQVFQRYILQHSLDWPEELARYLFVFSVYVGSSYATSEKRHLEVTICRTVFGEKIGHYFTILAYLITIVFCGIMFFWGMMMTQFVADSNQVAPALQFPMWIAYSCIPLGFFLMTIRTIIVLKDIVLSKGTASSEVIGY